MILEAAFCNADHPEYGVATIFFPLPQEEYDYCIGLLEELKTNGIGKNQLANQRSVCELERTSSGMSEFSRLRGNEGYPHSHDPLFRRSERRLPHQAGHPAGQVRFRHTDLPAEPHQHL